MQIFDAGNLSAGDFNQILSFLHAGGVIGFPTDTAYGLGADPFQESAVQRIFAIKGRPETKPILVLVDSMEMVPRVAAWTEVSDSAKLLAQRFWPGPLTMVLPALKTVPRCVTAGTGTIGVRWPQSAFVTRLLHAFGGPLTATSANKSGMPGTARVSEVQAQFQTDLQMLIDGGALAASHGSTIVDMTATPPRLIREGPVPRSVLSSALNGNLQ